MTYPLLASPASASHFPEPILRLSAVTRQYFAALPPAVAEVSLDLQSGDLLSLLGPSGCGKTTLLRLIAGFEAPQSGTVEIGQQLVAGAGCWVPPERRGVGMVFQDYALFPHLTVAQNIGFGLAKSPMQQQRVQETMALVGLQGLNDRFPHQLSGGQQQRVALARALAPNPVLVLLDEPLSNLDLQVRLRLRQELRQILKAAGTSAVLVTHDQEEALSISDRVAVMQQGRIEQIGTPELLYREPASRFVAEFVTQTNFLSAQRQADQWQTSLGTVPDEQLTSSSGLSGLDPFSQVELMLRQEDLLLSPDPDGFALIQDRQFLGREYRYQIQLADGTVLVARTALDHCFAVGTVVRPTIAPTALLRAFPALKPA
jgi:iron(III) transport system ATP-binding protein